MDSETSILQSLNLRFPWIYITNFLYWNAIRWVLKFPWILKSRRQKLHRFYTHFHSWSFWLTSVIIGPGKLAYKTCAASIVRMNSANKTSFGNKQVQPSQAKPSHTIFVWTLVGKASLELFSVQRLLWVKAKTFHLLWKCPQMSRKWSNNVKCFLETNKYKY